MYKCKHFGIKELVSKKVYDEKGEQCWRFFNPIALRGLDKLRDQFGAMQINNWHEGGIYDGRGYHLQGEEKRSEFSGHRAFGAFDLMPLQTSAVKMRIALLGEEPKANKTYPSIKGFEEITELEYGITWFHVRFCSNIGGVLVYSP